MLNIIVPLDMSETAERSLPLAQALAHQLSARVLLVSVIEVSSDLDDFVSTTEFKEDVVRLERDLSAYLDNLAARFEGVPVETIIRMGSPVGLITSIAGGVDRSLLVIASHGRSGIRRHLIGSVAMQLIHQVACPVYVVTAKSGNAAPVGPLQRALVPLDGSELSESALEPIAGLFEPADIHLHILRVAELGAWRAMPYATLDYYGDDSYYQAALQTVNTYLHDIEHRLQAQGYTVTTEARGGTVAEQIHLATTEQRADFIAMGTHGRAGLNRLIMGSIAERVLRESHVPVLLHRPAG